MSASPRLIAITPPLSDGDPRAACALLLGLHRSWPMAIMLRDHQSTASALITMGRELRQMCSAHDAMFLVNRRVDIAIATQAHGVHLPANGMTVVEARRLLGPTLTVGVSCHDHAELAQGQGADYVCLSPFAHTPGKGPPLSPEEWRDLCDQAIPPVIALGGISADNVGAAIEAGAHGVACIRAAFGGDDPGRLASSLSTTLDSRHPAKG